MNKRQRLCDRADLYGLDCLSDAELMAVATGIRQDRLHSLLDGHSLSELALKLDSLSLADSDKLQLQALFTVGQRLARSEYRKGDIIHCPQDVALLFMRELQLKRVEVVMAALLNCRNRLIRVETLSIGTVSEAFICTRELARLALGHNAAHVILAHCHPSGEPAPSRDDIETTRDLANALKNIGISLMDHIVVAGSQYTSLRQAGLM